MGCYPPEIRPVLRRRLSEAATWIAALKGLASEIRFRPGRHSLNLNAAVDLDEHEAHVVAETPKMQQKVSGFVERIQAEERYSAVAQTKNLTAQYPSGFMFGRGISFDTGPTFR
jgi:hypothetical protein